MSQIAELPLDDLKDELAAQAAHMSAGMCRYLQLVASHRPDGLGLDRGVPGLALRADAAFGRRRVARRLGELPLIREAFARVSSRTRRCGR